MLEAASTESVTRALATRGFALLSRLAVAAETQRGTLHAIPVRDVDLTCELRAVRDQTIDLADDRLAFWHWLGALAA